MFKQLIITIALLGTTFAHSAAENTGAPVATSQQLSDPFEIIGLSCSSHGNFSMISSADSRECSLTLVYSEHPKLKTSDVLNAMAISLSQKTLDYGSIKAACKDEQAKYTHQALETGQDAGRVSYTLIALQIKLTLELMESIGLTEDHTGHSSPEFHSIGLWGRLRGNNQKKYSAITSRILPLPSDTIVESAQTEAEKLQQQNPDKPFHLVLNLKRWKEIVAQKRTEAKEARRIQRQSTPDDGPTCELPPACVQQ